MIRTVARMGTIVTIHVVDPAGARPDSPELTEIDAGIDRACEWFARVEARCTRFDPESELMRLTAQVGVPVAASDMLYEAVRFAVAVAEESGGAFDPTVGLDMEARGFNREYSTGKIVRTALEPDGAVSFRDIRLDADRKTIALLRPLILDLGAVAKGLAIDMAARELRPFRHYAIDAGGDLYLAGHNPAGAPWTVGIRHPRHEDDVIESIAVSDMAVCTSGDYERRTHILDPRTGESPGDVASVTVVAPTAMAADALATAAFVLGFTDGIRLLERQGVDGVMLSPALERHATKGMHIAGSGRAILPHA